MPQPEHRESEPTTSLRSRRGRHGLVSAVLTVALLGYSSTHAEVRETERILGALGLTEGMVVADVGAGDGEWASELAQVVGPEGHVFATEVDEEDLAIITESLESAGVTQYTAVLGGQEDTGLPEACCDAILLRMVYHHFQKPKAMRASLARAMRPGARLVVVDITPQTDWRVLPGVPDRGGHGITPEALAAEMALDGFSVVERFDEWNDDEDRYCLVFRRD